MDRKLYFAAPAPLQLDAPHFEPFGRVVPNLAPLPRRETSYRTEAWVLREGPAEAGASARAELSLEEFTFPTLNEGEVLIEPLFGAWEGNYGHAIERSPIDICRVRGEKSVVLGNCGVVRVHTPGRSVTRVKEGDICLLTGNAVADEFGYMMKAHAYDAPNTIGILAKRSKVHERQLIVLPESNPYSLEQWAAFSLRYITAWANWRVAYGSWRLQISEKQCPNGFAVWGWGGGVSFAELALAKYFGADCALIASQDERLSLAAANGFKGIDRRDFAGLSFDPKRSKSDPEFRERYNHAEKKFLEIVKSVTGGKGVAIFIDNIGQPVFRATMKALARQGVVATAGWKCGMELSVVRAIECIARHTMVHTHYASHEEAEDAVRFACENDWMPPKASLEPHVRWEEIGRLANDYADGGTSSYFPLFQVNSR